MALKTCTISAANRTKVKGAVLWRSRERDECEIVFLSSRRHLPGASFRRLI
jgi:hypothetical protein